MPPTITTKRASIDDVLPLLKARVVLKTGIPADRVKTIARQDTDIPRFVAPLDLLLRFKGFRSDPDHRGRHDRRVVHRLHVTVRTRLEFDEADQDLRWLTDPAAGNVAAEDAVIDALEDFFPEDDQGNAYTYEGVHVLEGEEFVKAKDDPLGWGEVTVVFGVPVELPLTQLPAKFGA